MRTVLDSAARGRVRGTPVEIAFRELHPSKAAERQLHRSVQRLAKSFPELAGCRILVEREGAALDRGRCHVHIDLTLPGGRVEVDVPEPGRSAGHDLAALVREAFALARRKAASNRLQ